MISLIKKALTSMESMDVAVQVNGSNATCTGESTTAKNDTSTQASSNPVPGDKELTVVMDGPLSSIYHKALNLAYAKPDPITGVPATESLALTDYYKAIELRDKISDGEVAASDDDAVNIQTNGTILRAPVEQELIPVVKELESTGAPGDFVIINNTMRSTDDSPMGVDNCTGFVEMDKRVAISAEDVESYSLVIKLKPNRKV